MGSFASHGFKLFSPESTKFDTPPATAFQALDRANQRTKHDPETGSWVPPSLFLDVSTFLPGFSEPHGCGSMKINRHINRIVVSYFLPF